MIIIDYSQIAIASIMANMVFAKKKSLEVTDDILKHLILNSIRANVVKFKSQYGNVIIACDGRSSWRKDVFPFYKARRKERRVSSSVDWDHIHTIITNIKNDLKTYFPYKVIEVDKAEADDVIAVLATHFAKTEPVLIISGDNDFIQLHVNKNITQWSPIQKRFINMNADEINEYMFQHIVYGDEGDDIPNILSDNDVFVTDKRQARITKKNLDKYRSYTVNDFQNDNSVSLGYSRNVMLISFDHIPSDIINNIKKEYAWNESNMTHNKSILLKYFSDNKLRSLMSMVSDF